jgi:hypothetical protein
MICRCSELSLTFFCSERGLSSTEVGCEHFFALSGYVSAPRCTRLGVRNYERLAMLSSTAHVVYIDPAWVALEYLKMCSKGSWKKENDVDALISAGILGELLVPNC